MKLYDWEACDVTSMSVRKIFYCSYPGPPEINPGLKNQSLPLHSPLQVKCIVSGYPTPEVNWTKNGMEIGNNNTLTIDRVSLKDAGRYTCSAKNSEGTNETTFWIEVTGKVYAYISI